MQYVLWFATMIRRIGKTVLEVNQGGEAKSESVLLSHGDGLARLGAVKPPCLRQFLAHHFVLSLTCNNHTSYPTTKKSEMLSSSSDLGPPCMPLRLKTSSPRPHIVFPKSPNPRTEAGPSKQLPPRDPPWIAAHRLPSPRAASARARTVCPGRRWCRLPP
jgi:hypothetical protein